MNKLEKVKEILGEIIRKMNISVDSIDVIDSDEDSQTPKINVKTSDSALLIGVRGANLFALNHLIKRIITKGGVEEEDTKFFIDVNDYQVKLNEELRQKAKIMSDRARSFRVDVELDPMSSYERMIVHSALQDVKDITTESKGFGKERRIVIRYVESTE